MPGHGEQAAEVLEFWFAETKPRLWFSKDPAFDEVVQQHFLGLTRRAIAGELDAWNAEQARAVQEVALPLFERFSDPRTADFATRHRDVIARFGRFPHRNVLLGRVSSADELAFLQTPGSRFSSGSAFSVGGGDSLNVNADSYALRASSSCLCSRLCSATACSRRAVASSATPTPSRMACSQSRWWMSSGK